MILSMSVMLLFLMRKDEIAVVLLVVMVLARSVLAAPSTHTKRESEQTNFDNKNVKGG